MSIDIVDERARPTNRIDDMGVGETFMWNGALCVRLVSDTAHSSMKYNALVLDCAHRVQVGAGDIITPVNITITIHD